MKTLKGHFFDGLQPVAIEAQMDLEGHNATLTVGTVAKNFTDSQLVVSPRIASADRFIDFPDGTQFTCAADHFLDRLPQESASEGIVAWMENRWQAALACVAMVVITLVSAYFFGLPKLAKHIADQIPMEKEQKLGEQVLVWFDEKGWLTPTDLEFSTRKDISDGFKILYAESNFEQFYRLEFRSGRVFGPNAFALPGGVIVVTDELARMAETKEEVLAVLAHEIGHVELRHTLRSILQSSAIAAAATAITSDAATLSAVVAGLPAMLAQRKYSRNFEREADQYCFALLKRKGYSPEAFASIMDKFKNKGSGRFAAYSYLATHPPTEERIRLAREAAQNN